MNNYNIPLEPEKYYHIYNHAVGKSNLFETEANYFFFLEKYKQYISPYVDNFAYCLLPNHFHLAVRIKDIKNLQGFENLGGLKDVEVEHFLSQQFSNFFNSYSKSFNKQQSRRGGLFEQKFKRKHIHSFEYLINLIHYIHNNPVHHEFVEDLRDWKHSSFDSYLSSKASLLKRDEVIEWLGDKESFINFHIKKLNENIISEFE